jgi:diguanylate cyclase (GGDEF)-like protein
VLRTISVLGFAVAALSTVIAVRALLDGYRPARYFLLAWAGLLVFILFGALRNFALVPTNFVTIYGLHFGFALDVLLLSFALGDRISILRRERAQAHAEKLSAQQLLLEATRENERELERRIAQRTAELNSVNERLRAEASERESLMEMLRHQEEHLRFMAQHDPLTGLPNRLSMQQRLALAMELAKRNRKKVAVMLVDLDEFKSINDTLGHVAGDQALVQLAARLRTSVRGSDTVARYGGDEFVILAGELERAEDAGVIAEKVADMIQLPLALEGGPAKVSCSIGISVYPDDAEDGEALIARADKAMYASKSAKDRRYAFFGAA